jgi:hypothetical protein
MIIIIFFVEQKCNKYIKQNIRAPPVSLIYKWGQQLKLSKDEIKNVNSNLLIRHRLGINSQIYLYTVPYYLLLIISA